jgi:hypothetical protein
VINAWVKTKKLPAATKTSDMIPYREGKWSGVLLGVVTEIVFRDLYESHRNRTGEELSRDDVDHPELAKSADLYCEDTHGKYKIRVNRFKFPKFEDQINRIDTDVDFVLAVVSKNNYPGKTTRVDQMWVITP